MNRISANVLLILVAIFWGSSYAVQQTCSGELGTMSFTGARFLIGALVVAPFAFRQYLKRKSSDKPALTRKDFVLFAITGLMLYTAAALQQYGIVRTSVANSGFLTSLYVPLVPILGLLILRQMPHISVWPASVCCVIGTYIMSGADFSAISRGDSWIIGSSLFWAIHMMLVGKVAQRTNAPLIFAFIQFFVCGIFGLSAGFVLESPTVPQLMSSLNGILYVGIISVGAAFTLQVVAQVYTPTTDAVIILSSEAVFAAISGMIFLNETISMAQLQGAILILVSVFIVELVPIFALKQKAAKSAAENKQVQEA